MAFLKPPKNWPLDQYIMGSKYHVTLVIKRTNCQNDVIHFYLWQYNLIKIVPIIVSDCVIVV
jgi:hypothetical protein